MNRRRFLLSACVGAGALLGGRFALVEARAAILMIVRKRLGYLQLDEAGLQQFAADLAARQATSPLKLKALQTAAPLYRHLHVTGYSALATTLNHGEERIASAYLLASDFFHNGADERKLVRYIRLYEPHINLDACSAPFSRPVVIS